MAFSEKATIFNDGQRKGFRLQDLEGHIYQIIGNLSPGVVYWRCQFARRNGTKCKAKIKTVGDGWVVSRSDVHNHRKSRPSNPARSLADQPSQPSSANPEASRSLLKPNIDPLYYDPSGQINISSISSPVLQSSLGNPRSFASQPSASRSLLKSSIDPLYGPSGH